MTATRVSAVTAYTAHREWASRPPDERYVSVHALYDAARARHARIEERTTETVDLRTEVVDDDDLAFLYRQALCLVFPSRVEGFGLPPLEAMALGCPVISSDAASLPEVCGEAVLYAPPDEAAAWLIAIGRIAAEPILRERLAAVGPKRAESFSWRKSTEKYLELMFALDLGTRDI